MATKDGREIARDNEVRLLKSLHKFGWLRARDLAALHWMPSRTGRGPGFVIEAITISPSALRMAQRTLARLRRDRMAIHMQAPDGSQIYGLAEAGARRLAELGIPAKSGKDQVRRVSMSHFHHRRVANEIAIIAALQGCRVSSEMEISAGQWFAGAEGIRGKRPDVAVRFGKDVWLVEVERSRRNEKDYAKLLGWLVNLWSSGNSVELSGGHRLQQVVFVCDGAFANRLVADLARLGWSEEQITMRVTLCKLLYVTEATFINKVAR